MVSLLNGKFKAIYYKPPGRPNLILRERTKPTTTRWRQKHFKLRLPRHASWGGFCSGGVGFGRPVKCLEVLLRQLDRRIGPTRV